jgi:hypothetical protein
MILSALKSLLAKFERSNRGRRVGAEQSGSASGADRVVSEGLLQAPTREDIRQCYRLILGREPENDRTLDEHMQYPSVAAIRIAALKSIEFRGKYRAICAERPDPYWSSTRDALAFIHVEKTGGTSLRDLLAAQFEEDRVCPGPNNPLYSFSVAELGHYDFFAGHFDLDSVRYIPRQNIKTVSLFREPRSRLISWYRFHKSHPPQGEHGANRLVVLANELTPDTFFESPEVRASELAYNRYLLAFGRSFSWFNQQRDLFVKTDLDAALRDAKSSIRALTALGITEQFDRSARYICKTFNLPPPATIKSTNVTDEMPSVLAGFRRVEPVQMTPRLVAALDELTVYDQEIYRFALTEFERRCAESEKTDEGLSVSNLVCQ